MSPIPQGKTQPEAESDGSQNLQKSAAESALKKKARTTLARTAICWGKVGLVLDDARDADAAVARELYGTETLPEWWLVARSIPCAAAMAEATGWLLKASREEVLEQIGVEGAEPADGPLLAGLFVVVDRFLLGSCGRSRVLQWDPLKESVDSATSGCADRLKEALKCLEGKAEEDSCPCCEVVFVSSHPHPGISWKEAQLGSIKEQKNAPFEWRAKGSEELRRRFQSACKKADALGRFGPEKESVVTSLEEKYLGLDVSLVRARHEATHWSVCVEEMACVLEHSEGGAVLVTGEGAAWPAHRRTPGLDWDQIEYEAETEQAERVAANEKGARECLCLNERRHARALRARRDVYGGMIEVWPFVDQVQARRDRLFPHHYWLLHQLPWEWIITLNTDHFHERAADRVGPGRVKEKDLRELGIVRPLVLHKDEADELGLTGRLLKPVEPWGVELARLAANCDEISDSHLRRLLDRPMQGGRPLSVAIGRATEAMGPKSLAVVVLLGVDRRCLTSEVEYVLADSRSPTVLEVGSWGGEEPAAEKREALTTLSAAKLLKGSCLAFCFDLLAGFSAREDLRISKEKSPRDDGATEALLREKIGEVWSDEFKDLTYLAEYFNQRITLQHRSDLLNEIEEVLKLSQSSDPGSWVLERLGEMARDWAVTVPVPATMSPASARIVNAILKENGKKSG